MRDITEPKAIEQERARYREDLEDEVRRRTNELQVLVKAMTGRELRMAELKKEIEKLRARLGEGA